MNHQSSRGSYNLERCFSVCCLLISVSFSSLEVHLWLSTHLRDSNCFFCVSFEFKQPGFLTQPFKIIKHIEKTAAIFSYLKKYSKKHPPKELIRQRKIACLKAESFQVAKADRIIQSSHIPLKKKKNFFFCPHRGASRISCPTKWRTKSELKCVLLCLFSTFSKLRTTNLKVLQPRKCYVQKDIYCKICLPTNQQHVFVAGMNSGCEMLHSMMLRVSSESTWRGDNQVWLETTRGPARHPRIQESKQGRITDLQKLTDLKSFCHLGRMFGLSNVLSVWTLFPTCWGKRFS